MACAQRSARRRASGRRRAAPPASRCISAERSADAFFAGSNGATDMAGSHGCFVWYELTTTDTEAAQTFYAEVVGWGTQDASMAGAAYTLFTAGDAPVSGL